ncbi:hypothetical protein RxyAA322_30100 [Rubrobacter xylanophilus]|uniref:Sulfatase N-terminal domain-containing protein n=1 Tax=Rubrobacter xylanophilus TaxID=49319 RepID=A0A510HMC9_9ACTN|nr:sulfatase-like hydrolase/transferase [Rubrobacter xylanophilus]BBL81156.1 hypothetical protein RxyAA322_30100 [Rubrobacter xylanophilus]
MPQSLRTAALSLLDRRDWFYLLWLLVPLAAYTLLLRLLGLRLQGEAGEFFGTLGLLRSDFLFLGGYALLSVGLLAIFRRGWGRWAALVVLHASAVLVVVISTSAYQYLSSTGATLDYSVVAYYLTSFGEATGAISSEAPLYMWLILAEAVLYAAFGPWVFTRAFLGPRRRAGGSASSRGVSRRRFIVSGVGAGAGVLLLRESLLPEAARGQGTSVSRSPVSNLIATRIEESRMDAAAESVRVANTLGGIRLEPTFRTRKRHVALIHLESTRERSVTPYNRDIATMPLLAGLARDNSLLVEWAYTTTPHTSKAITSVNTGLYPHPDTEIVESRPGAVPAPGIAALLAEQGYRTAWFQSATEKFEDRARLVENFGYGHFQAYEDMRTEGFQRSNYLGYEDDIMLEPSRRWLEENASSPTLVMYLGVTPHHEYRPVDRYGRRRFSGEKMLDRYLNNVRYDDFWVRNIIRQYKELGLYEDTIFIIYGDHGEAFGEHGLKGHDPIPYEEVLRVPLIIHDPQGFDGGARIEGPVQLIDFPPTIVDLLGFRVTGGEYIGRSLLQPPEERTLLFSCRPDVTAMASIRGYEKYIYHYGKRPEEFYDLSRDPTEQNDLASRVGRRELRRRREELLEWHARTAAIFEEHRRPA